MRKDFNKNIRSLKKLITSGVKLSSALQKIESQSFLDLYTYSVVLKTTNLLYSINLLISVGQILPAQILARVLIETKINLDYLILLLAEDSKVTERIPDAAMLHKNKLVMAAGWGGHKSPFKNWNKIIEEIKSKYSKEELKKIKKLGYFDCDLEKRAKKTKNAELYNHGYRQYSQNIHNFDMHEILEEGENNYYYQASRLGALLEAANKCGKAILATAKEVKKNLP